ncbi:MAG: hypothetical protein R2705_10305 [Ilumatobacteraceae bacterium]
MQASAALHGLDWPASMSLGQFRRTLVPGPQSASFLAVRRAGGSRPWSFTEDDPDPAPRSRRRTFAPPRRCRLADRYVLEAAVALTADRPDSRVVTAGFETLPDVMNQAEPSGSGPSEAVVDLVRAATLAGREGETRSGPRCSTPRSGRPGSTRTPAGARSPLGCGLHAGRRDRSCWRSADPGGPPGRVQAGR